MEVVPIISDYDPLVNIIIGSNTLLL